MVRQDILDAGYVPGGEGCQYPQTISMDRKDGQFILYATDVGGIFRSTDGGKRFEPCDTGFSAVGACGFAIDPRNPDRCLAVGDNSGNEWYPYDGVYLSTDRGATWAQVLPKTNHAGEKGREQIAFDTSSFDAAKGCCTVAYWAEEGNKQEQGGRLYKSTDGGASWLKIADGAGYGGGNVTSILKIHPAKGWIFIANDYGFYKSTDGGATFARKLEGKFTGLDSVPGKPDVVWLTRSDAILRSDDAGETFTPLTFSGLANIAHLQVSPADPRRMIAIDSRTNERYFSANGGATWTKSRVDMRHSWIPPDILYNDRNKQVAWHPTNPDVAFAIGPGDVMSKTVDGGRTFEWANNGNNGIMIGGLFNFNVENPDILYFGSQDYNGGLTRDAGKTWKFMNLSISNTHAKRGDDSDPWGWVYGAYAADDQVLFGGNRAYTENEANLWITFDGGKTSEQKVFNLTGAQVSYGDPTDPNVLFCWSYRSADRGRNWARMAGCDGVFTSNPTGDHELFGRSGKSIVRSKDHGVTWEAAAAIPAEVHDLAYDQKRDRFYAAADNHLYRCDGPAYSAVDLSARLPKDQHGDGFMATTVAVDPVDPSVVYAGACGTGLFFQRNNAVARSVDAGLTWERLTCNPKHGMSGGQMASAIRVHPKNRYLYVGTCCFGMWRIAPPAADAATPANLEPAFGFKNGDMSAGTEKPTGWEGSWDDARAFRDTQVFKSAPASLRVEAGGKPGMVFQQLEVAGGARVRLIGVFKVAGASAQVFLQAFDTGWTKNQFTQVIYLQGDADWTPFTKDITLPDWAARLNIGIRIEGAGKAYLDDVQFVSAETPAVAVAAAQGPWVPSQGFYPDFPQAWRLMHNSLIDRTKKGDIDIIFFGDSITQGWGGAGKDLWDRRYAPLKAVNYGIGGDSTRQVLWRILNGEVEGLHPKLIVLKIGTNNLYADRNGGSDEEIARGIETTVKTLRQKLPETKILLLAILPRQNEYFCGRIQRVNVSIAKLDDGKMVRYLDMGPKFQEAFGKVKADLYVADQLHLGPKGYQVWAETMDPLFTVMLK